MLKKLKGNRIQNRPTVDELKSELSLLKEKKKRSRNLRYIIVISLSAVAVIILMTNLWFPMFRVVGTSMMPQLTADDIIVCFDADVSVERGNIIAFYHNDTVLLKRVVGISGDIVDMDENGVLSVNGVVQNEPYASGLSLEPCDVVFPVQVPENSFFVLGDQRSTSLDSRSESIGMITEERLIGKAVMRVWPILKFELL
ncbi:MAG: signal peptidase I [Ruminococcus sp.]|nr:signal peptidase I [Ruminococcus sp.]